MRDYFASSFFAVVIMVMMRNDKKIQNWVENAPRDACMRMSVDCRIDTINMFTF